jgi:hypothetical protein
MYRLQQLSLRSMFLSIVEDTRLFTTLTASAQLTLLAVTARGPAFA